MKCGCRICESRRALGQQPKHGDREPIAKPKQAPLEASIVDPEVARLVQAAKQPISFSALCDALDLSPRKAQLLIERAVSKAAPIHVEHDTVSIAPAPASSDVVEIDYSGPTGSVFRIGAISDTHVGSKYCLRGAIRETVQWFYENGVRDVLHSGDVLEGCYRHAQYELSHVGFDAQVKDAAKVFPVKPDLTYHFISGNHDYTFEEKIGMRAGIAIQEGLTALGRSDWRCYGDRDAYVKIGGATINLWHPRGAPAYALSYQLQKRVEGYTAIKPQIVLMGHYHQFCYAFIRAVHSIMMPCFQGSGSNFAKSLRGPPSIGGLILEWELNERGLIHNFRPHTRFFYEREDIFEARNTLDAIEIPAVGREKRYR